MNRKKDMLFYTLWVKKGDEKELLKLLKKKNKKECDFISIGKILDKIYNEGDLKKG